MDYFKTKVKNIFFFPCGFMGRECIAKLHVGKSSAPCRLSYCGQQVLYKVHLFTCWISTPALDGKKEELSVFERGMVVWARQAENFRNCWPTWILMYKYLWGSENGPKKRIYSENIQLPLRYPLSGNCVKEKFLLMWEFRGEWADWLEMIERQH